MPAEEILTPMREKILREFPMPGSPAAQVKAQLAKQLLVLGREEPEPVRQCALLQRAMELACEGGEARILGKCMEVLTAQFDVAPVPLAAHQFGKCIANLKDSRRQAELIECVERLIGTALADEDYQGASSLAAVLAEAATRVGGQTLRDQARKRQSYLDELVRVAEQFRAATALLAQDANNPQAGCAS